MIRYTVGNDGAAEFGGSVRATYVYSTVHHVYTIVVLLSNNCMSAGLVHCGTYSRCIQPTPTWRMPDCVTAWVRVPQCPLPGCPLSRGEGGKSSRWTTDAPAHGDRGKRSSTEDP